MPGNDARFRRPGINRGLHPRGHRDRPHPPVLSDQIHDAPAAVALLDVLRSQVRQFAPPQSAPEKRSEHGAVAQPLLGTHVRRVQERLRPGGATAASSRRARQAFLRP